MREPRALAAHRLDQVLFGRAQQLGVARDRLGIIEDRDVHVRVLRRASRASAGSRRDSRPAVFDHSGIAHHHIARTGRKAETAPARR